MVVRSRRRFDEIMAKTEEHNLFGAPVRELHEAYDEPQAQHNGIIVEHGPSMLLGCAIVSSAVPIVF